VTVPNHGLTFLPYRLLGASSTAGRSTVVHAPCNQWTLLSLSPMLAHRERGVCSLIARSRG